MAIKLITLFLAVSCVMAPASLFKLPVWCGTGVAKFEPISLEIPKNVRAPLEFPMGLLRSLYVDKKIYGHPLLLKYLGEHLELARRVIYRWYGIDRSVKLLAKMKHTEEYLLPLMSDPGIYSRVDEFLSFYRHRSREIEGKSLSEIRSRFSDHLGSKIWFARTPFEAEALSEQGIVSRVFVSEERIDLVHDWELKTSVPVASSFQERNFQNFVRHVTEEGPFEEVVRWINGRRHRACSIPVSGNPLLAATMSSEEDATIVEVEVNEIDVVSRHQLAMSTAMDPYVLLADGVRVARATAPEVESFVFLHLPPSQMRGSQRIVHRPERRYTPTRLSALLN